MNNNDDKKQRFAESFRAKLQELCDNYGAEISAEDHYPGWPECGEDVRMTVKFQHPEVGYTELDLGRFFP